MSDSDKTEVQKPAVAKPEAGGLPPLGDGFAVASLVLGILSCLFFWFMPLCGLFAALSVFLGRVAQRRIAATQNGRPGARSWATAGITLSLTGVLICVVSLGSCFLAAHYLAADGKKEYGKAIHDLESDPDFEKNVKELHEELDKLDDGSAPDGSAKDGSSKDVAVNDGTGKVDKLVSLKQDSPDGGSADTTSGAGSPAKGSDKNADKHAE